jgi:membrane protein DedA with SNARE-associated domain
MNLKDFVLFTFIGSAIWNSCLALLGYFFYSQKELLNKYFKELSLAVLVVGVIFVVYLVIKAWKKKKLSDPAV